MTLSARVDGAFEAALRDKRIVGAVNIVMVDGQVAHRKAYGLRDRESGVAMTPETIFRLASITKPIVTAAVMRMIEQGKLSLDAPVTQWLPYLTPKLPDGSAPAITIRHLLTHTSGLSYDFMQPEGGPYMQHKVSSGIGDAGLTLEENLKRAAGAGLTFPPGAMWLYSIAIDALGRVLEVASGKTLPEVVDELVAKPLGMTDTSFFVTDKARLATPYANAAPEPIRVPETHKQPFIPGLGPISFALSNAFDGAKIFPSGGGGMNGTADEVVRFLDIIRSGGGPILKPETTRVMMTNQIGPLRVLFDPSGSTGFGFGGAVILDPPKANWPLTPNSMYWGGVWGHSWFIDPGRKMTILNLTNTMLEGMSGQLVRDVVNAACSGV
jgi:CubicO group peptidase (beta-lactamase class C family)